GGVPRLDQEDEEVAGPALADRLSEGPLAGLRVGDLVEESDRVGPGDLCKHLLHKCRAREGAGLDHPVQIVTNNPANSRTIAPARAVGRWVVAERRNPTADCFSRGG